MLISVARSPLFFGTETQDTRRFKIVVKFVNVCVGVVQDIVFEPPEHAAGTDHLETEADNAVQARAL